MLNSMVHIRSDDFAILISNRAVSRIDEGILARTIDQCRTNIAKCGGCGSFRTGGSGAVERKMDLSYYGSSEGILGLGSWVGQNNLTRKTERLDCWDLLT